MTYQNCAVMEPAQKKKQLMPNSNRYKTELCKNWQNGVCEYNDKCIFAHGYHEMRPKMYPNFRTQLCKNYSSYRWCPYGSRCQFIHEDSAEQESINVTLPSSQKTSRESSRRGSFRSYKDAIADPTNYGKMTIEGLSFEDVECDSNSTCSSPRNEEERLRPRLRAFQEITSARLNESDSAISTSFEEESTLKKRRSNSA
mmetsp:Transcript_40130/g.45866  ORF Transcript_40130/g.45866 Transcript_40130/m.45866 type:complete len:199 (+) Transcript_40130:467-1063(+)